MNPDVKKLWVEALRSGEYEQGYEHLCIDGQYCCLGVLSDIAVKAGVQPSFRGREHFPTKKIVKWAGLPSRDPVVYTHIGEKRVSFLNDSEWPFSIIADLIESQL